MEEKNNWKIGDVVILKSGGPLMTVIGFDDKDKDEVYVKWYEHGSNQFAWNNFDYRALTVAPAKF